MRGFEPSLVPVPPQLFPLLPQQGTRHLDVEIGSGVGLFALRYARAHPERTLISFERTEERFGKFLRRLEHHEGLPNLVALRGDAIHWISHGLKPASVDRYFLLYPNPYPKEKQRNLRWMNMPFMDWLIKTLKPGGTIDLASNEEFYIREAEAVFAKEWRLDLVSKEKVDREPITHFEKKYLERGESCWHLQFRKREPRCGPRFL